ncbi:hypothetical protein COT75_05475 [Candidatus Beckwithbacteria bacterium CG10_big_fil_rev_8_21_14_0_10_34_10]|uniref:Metallo-beta-lactamase domain-containing protein n=1 Tax=Candidatus Beckwithbacteria bacterium CG10_big_fil_rev_8_21_14_0_10_34_10 TaxID=1974495 RepID=A0A2H0W9S1_9BACT|nr:MAG: hypothetical protein COT75_05475 [Candidatus Beckwithbacteria bacterium CG10_big_fil_rev_8_21_14_0_10_34_10]
MASLKKYIVVVLASILLLPFFFVFYWPENNLQLIGCNVGQGDAFLLTKGFNQVLIDGGPDSKVLSCLNENLPFWDRKIELIINSHPDKDHLAGLVDVLSFYKIEQIITNGVEVDRDIFKAFMALVKKKNIPVFKAKKGDKIKFSNLEFDFYWPEEKVLGAEAYKVKTNEQSLVFLLKYQGKKALFTGDISSQEEKVLAKNDLIPRVDVLKIAHHGSKYSTSSEFLEKVNPKIAIISVGENSWGHPTKEILDKLKALGVKVFRTDEDKVKIKF